MCGACSRKVATDPWSGLLATRRARWEATRTVNDVLRRAGHPGRVDVGSGPWVVRSGTGAAVLADTVTDVWRQLVAVRPIDEAHLAHPDDATTSPVALAVLDAARHVRAKDIGSQLVGPHGATARRVRA